MQRKSGFVAASGAGRFVIICRMTRNYYPMNEQEAKVAPSPRDDFPRDICA
jgi:hypothetical protein